MVGFLDHNSFTILRKTRGFREPLYMDLSHSKGTLSLAFSRDGRVLVSGQGDNFVHTWPLVAAAWVAPTGIASTAGDEDAIQRAGWQPLHVAAWDGDLAAMRKLLAAHANVDERNELGRTPLYLAARRGNLEAVKLLAAAGANVDAPALRHGAAVARRCRTATPTSYAGCSITAPIPNT